MSTEQTPFDPQRVYTEIARLVQLLSPGADMIELRFEMGGRKAKLPIPTVAHQKPEGLQPEAIDDSSLAGSILQVLKEHAGEWLTGGEIAQKVGGDANYRSGAFIRAIKRLKTAGLIDWGGNSSGQGYRLRNN